MSEYDAGADYINCAPLRESRASAAFGNSMIGTRTARGLMAAGWVTASASALLTALLAYRGAARLNLLNLIDAGLLALLARGIFRASRVCAILAVAYCLLNASVRLRMIYGTVPLTAFAWSAAPVALLYSLSVVGAFAWHRRATDLGGYSDACGTKPLN